MKIGIDIRMAGTQNGGIGRYISELVNGLVSRDLQNDYFLFYRDNSNLGDLDLEAKTAKTILVKAPFRHYSLKEQLLFPRVLKKYNLDLAHFPNFNVPIRYKRPFVVTIHDLIHHKLGGVKKTNFLHFFAYKKVIGSAVLSAKKIITVSEASKKDLVEEFSVPEAKVSVIYEGVSLSGMPTEKQIAEVKGKYLLSRPYFLFVGVLQRNKNLPGLTVGFNKFLARSGLDFDLCIVGKTDPHYPEIKAQALNIKHAEHLVFTGEVSDEDLKSLYAGANAFVSASRFEGFGLPGLEAMSYGLPLAVSNIPVFNEIYENGAIYFDNGNTDSIAECLRLLAQDRLYYMQVRAKAQARVKAFSWEKCAQETLQVYKTALI